MDLVRQHMLVEEGGAIAYFQVPHEFDIKLDYWLEGAIDPANCPHRGHNMPI
jgi:hypothetical protein